MRPRSVVARGWKSKRGSLHEELPARRILVSTHAWACVGISPEEKSSGKHVVKERRGRGCPINPITVSQFIITLLFIIVGSALAGNYVI